MPIITVWVLFLSLFNQLRVCETNTQNSKTQKLKATDLNLIKSFDLFGKESSMGDSFEYFGKRGSYGGSGSEGGGDEDFEEEDVWSVVNHEKSAETSSSSKLRTLTPRRLVPTASRIMIPRGSGNNETKQVLQQSAPVNIPDWSKIYRKNLRKGGGGGGSKIISHGFMDGDDDDDDDVRNEDVNDEDEDVDEDKVPPHEWIAKKLARSQISSFSVCEGVGRTLKGRDLSKVRNAVLTKTGFLE